MKTKSFFLSILLLILTSTILSSCSPNSTDDEVYEIQNVDKSIKRPGDQGGGN